MLCRAYRLFDLAKEQPQLFATPDTSDALYHATVEVCPSRAANALARRCRVADDSAIARCRAQAARAAGYEQYEPSSFGRRGARSVHNQAYWHGHDYVGTPVTHATGHHCAWHGGRPHHGKRCMCDAASGIGPGAHGRFLLAHRPGVREHRIQVQGPRMPDEALFSALMQFCVAVGLCNRWCSRRGGWRPSNAGLPGNAHDAPIRTHTGC